jgi:phosphoenolpyruvate carboxykinase (ATP)
MFALLLKTPWANLFCYNMFLRPEAAELANFAPEWTVLCVPSLWLILLYDGTRQTILLF